jgi:ribonuclease HI
LIELSHKHQIEWIKVAGHADNIYNNICDRLAREAIVARGGVDRRSTRNH